jgi:hypothetical protein
MQSFHDTVHAELEPESTNKILKPFLSVRAIQILMKLKFQPFGFLSGAHQAARVTRKL